MNDQKGGGGGGDKGDCCYFHPKEVVVGVCPLCLYERLLVLAAKQGNLSQTKGSRINLRSRSFSQSASSNNKSPIVRPKIFALSSLLNRFEFRHRKSDNFDTCSSISQDDSFISIQFGNNGAASWEKGKVSKVSLDHCNMTWKNQNLSKGATKEDKTVIEHAKPRASSLRWRKWIGHLFQVMRWKKSSKGSVCHVGGKMEGVKVRNGWIRALTKRRTKE